jgi:hypothetical protein
MLWIRSGSHDSAWKKYRENRWNGDYLELYDSAGDVKDEGMEDWRIEGWMGLLESRLAFAGFTQSSCETLWV